MTGEQLREVLALKHMSQKRVAALLGIAQQTLGRKLDSDSIKTSLLEELCDKLNCDLYFFYGGTKYLPTERTITDPQYVQKNLYDEIRQENIALHIQVSNLQQKIALLEETKDFATSGHQKNAV